MTTTGRRAAAGGLPPPDVTNAASISGQSIPSGLALHQGLIEHQEPGVPVEWLEQPRSGGEPVPARARTRGGGRPRFHQATTVAKMTATIAAMPWTVLIQSTCRVLAQGSPKCEAVEERPAATCPAGRDVIGEAVLRGLDRE
jgi:hypothetical protein